MAISERAKEKKSPWTADFIFIFIFFWAKKIIKDKIEDEKKIKVFHRRFNKIFRHS